MINGIERVAQVWSAQRPITLIIADDQRTVIEGLCSLLAGQPDFKLCGSCYDGEAALRLITEHQPAVPLLDYVIPMNGLEVLSRVQQHSSTTRVVLLAGAASDAQMLGALAQGARGLLAKAEAATSLMDCLRAVAAGERWYPKDFLVRATRSGHCASGIHDGGIDRAVQQGDRKAGWADRGTVKVHLYNIYKKLGISTRSGLAAVALSI
jgi:two-component system NarL family response regulator/two-component system nitrate/nitrite response regulator NarL